jgi:hypothetical protein
MIDYSILDNALVITSNLTNYWKWQALKKRKRKVVRIKKILAREKRKK